MLKGSTCKHPAFKTPCLFTSRPTLALTLQQPFTLGNPHMRRVSPQEGRAEKDRTVLKSNRVQIHHSSSSCSSKKCVSGLRQSRDRGQGAEVSLEPHCPCRLALPSAQGICPELCSRRLRATAHAAGQVCRAALGWELDSLSLPLPPGRPQSGRERA